MNNESQKIDIHKYLRLPFSKCNCWQLTQRVFADCGVALPDYKACVTDAKAINECVTWERSRWRRIATPVTPCVVLMRNDMSDPSLCNHFGVYIGGGKVLHTMEKTGPTVIKLDNQWWASRIEGFYVPRG